MRRLGDARARLEMIGGDILDGCAVELERLAEAVETTRKDLEAAEFRAGIQEWVVPADREFLRLMTAAS